MRTNKYVFLFLIVIIVSIFFTSFKSVSAQSGDAVFRTDPPTLQIGQGQVETIKIILENAQGIYGIDYQATFDPDVVEIVDADPDREGVQMIPGDFIKPDFVVLNTADNKAGTLQYVAAQVNPTPPATGTGVVLLIQFRGKALGGKSDLTITSVQIADQRGNKMPNIDKSGKLIVVLPKPPTPTVIPTNTPFLPITGLMTPQIQSSNSLIKQSSPSKIPYSVYSDRIYNMIAYLAFGIAILLIIVAGWMLRSKKKNSNKESSE
jgi:hypothetical protein